jgi:hypothetical protein
MHPTYLVNWFFAFNRRPSFSRLNAVICGMQRHHSIATFPAGDRLRGIKAGMNTNNCVLNTPTRSKTINKRTWRTKTLA